MLLARLLMSSFMAAEQADRVLSRAFPYRWTKGVLLDKLLGPADSFEYVSKTAPAGPPPTIS